MNRGEGGGDVRIDTEFRRSMPVITEKERGELRASIKAEGCRDALCVWEEEDILLDGHNRKDICEELKVGYKTKKISLPSRLDALIWIRRNQAARRNLTDDQRAMNAAELAELLSKKAMRERAAKGTPAREAKKKGTLAAASTPKVKTRTAAAKQSRVSEHKVRQAQAVKKASPERAKQVAAGEIPLAQAIREIKREVIVEKLENIEAKKAKAIEGVYDVIVIDPPWPMEKMERDCRPNQVEFDYPRMTLGEIRWLKIPHAKDCHVWMWTTQKFLAETLSIFHQRRWKFVCVFIWHKPGGFQPIGLPQFNAEFAVYGRLGKPSFIDTKAFPVCFTAPRGSHSEKPAEFYDMVRRVTGGRRLDMFSRRNIDGFDAYGNEAQK